MTSASKITILISDVMKMAQLIFFILLFSCRVKESFSNQGNIIAETSSLQLRPFLFLEAGAPP